MDRIWCNLLFRQGLVPAVQPFWISDEWRIKAPVCARFWEIKLFKVLGLFLGSDEWCCPMSL